MSPHERILIRSHPAGPGRDNFLTAVEAVATWKGNAALRSITVDGEQIDLREACAAVAACSDIVPNRAWNDLVDIGADKQAIRTYAAGARAMGAWLQQNR